MNEPSTSKPSAIGEQWRRSSYCADNNCVEVSRADGRVRLRASGEAAVVIDLSPAEWAAFVRGVRDGEFG